MAGNSPYVITQPGPPFPGSSQVYGGGGSLVDVAFRDPLDKLRASGGSLPEAQYPSGYLGNIVDRQQDKLLGKVKERLNDRSYQRGVHVGSKVGQKAYYWDKVMNPMMGLERQNETASRAGNTISTARYAPSGDPVERLAHGGTTASFSMGEQAQLYRQYGVETGKTNSPLDFLKTMRPPWS